VAVAPGTGVSRRRVLAGLALLVPALAGCADARRERPVDPLIALADAARADAALGTAVITADRGLTERVQPWVDARTQHAAALDTEVLRRLGRTGPTPSAAPVPTSDPARPVDLARLRAASRASADAAAAVALELPADRIGLVAAVAACCAGYATVLT
jgi:hypothetical protein